MTLLPFPSFRVSAIYWRQLGLRCIVETTDEIHIHVRVQPKASRNVVLDEQADRLRIRLTAPPVDGAANEALCAFVAKRLGIAKSTVRLIRGERSRDKTLSVQGVSAEDAWARLTYGAAGGRL